MSRRACRLFRNAGLFAGLFEFCDDRVGDVGAAVEYDALIHDYGELLLVGDGPHGEVDFLEERLHELSFFLGELLALRLVDFGFFLVVALFVDSGLRVLLELFGHVANLALHLLEFRVLEHDLLRVDGSDRVGGEGRAREDESR